LAFPVYRINIARNGLLITYNQLNHATMKIGILGTGSVGQTLASALVKLRHDVVIGTRNVEETLLRTSGAYGGPSFSLWNADNPKVKLSVYKEAAAFADILINATHGGSSIQALTLAGAENLRGKILIDLSNPLDFSKGMPPILYPELCNTNSLGEEIQKTFPVTRVVKTLNTMWCGLMVNPSLIEGGDHNVFICGNDAEAKNKVTALLQELGWKSSRISDLGDITAARGTEMILPLWLRVMGTVGNGAFNFKIVR
jgi:predicted dinucleotide-binding enzyme